MRNDVHSPKNLNPVDYEWVAPEVVKITGLGDVEWALHNRELIRAHMARTGGTYSRHSHGGNCGVCGNVNAVYTILFYHAKTNSYVRMGQECAELVDDRAGAELNTLRDRVRDWREAEKGKKKAMAVLADANLTAAWEIYSASGEGKREEMIVRDIVGKLVRYGSISDKQMNFLGSLLRAIDERPAREAAKAAEHEAAAPCPVGKAEVAGEVLSVRVDEGGLYGPVTKMLVKSDAGFKVWGTMPAHAHADRGDRIVFKATFEPSHDDPKFGFFKRPRLIDIAHTGKPEPAESAT